MQPRFYERIGHGETTRDVSRQENKDSGRENEDRRRKFAS